MPIAAVIVAHPDDESLWCGGQILQRPAWDWFVLTLCRGSDRDRAERFGSVLRYLGANGAMGDLDDGPEQRPLAQELVQRTILERLPARAYDLVFTHGPRGEYTRHLRHQECSAAVVSLWKGGAIDVDELKLFAYDDEGGTAAPRICADADERHPLDPATFTRKLYLVTDLYGFSLESWEARATPATEGFYRLTRSERPPLRAPPRRGDP